MAKLLNQIRKGYTILAPLQRASTFTTQAIPLNLEGLSATANNVRKDATKLIGRTPIVYVNKVTEGCEAQVAAKLEFMQPSFSVKDRPAYAMIEDAEKRWLITPGKVIV